MNEEISIISFSHKKNIFLVAGSTSLALLVARLVVARVLIPKFNKSESVGQTSETKKSNSETMDMAIKFLKLDFLVSDVCPTDSILLGMRTLNLILIESKFKKLGENVNIFY